MRAMPRKRQQGLSKAGDVARNLHLPLTAAQQRLIEAAADIALMPATADDACFLHTVLCQVGMPRKKTEALQFERTNGSASLLLTAGKLWDGRQWVQQLLPYGPKPRVVLINLTSAAVKTGSPVVDVGRSTREFMTRVGLDPQGSEYRSLRRQLAALSVCRMQLGATFRDRIVNVNTQPISRFDVWLVPDMNQRTLWPGQVELSQEYFQGLQEFAVPLDERAVAALRGSALALDLYSWLAHRLCRIRQPGGVPIRWQAIKSQFGQEYRNLDDFRKEARSAFRQVLQVYRSAKVEETPEGLRLRESPPPIPKIVESVLPGRLVDI